MALSIVLSASMVGQAAAPIAATNSQTDQMTNALRDLQQQVRDLRTAVAEIHSEAAQYRAEAEALRQELQTLRNNAQAGTSESVNASGTAQSGTLEQRVAS